MLSRHRRLRAAQVAEIIRQGRSLRGKFLSAKVLPSGSATMRAAVVIGKSTLKRAVDRNRARRACYRALAAQKNPQFPFNAVFFVRTLPIVPLTPAFAADIEQMIASLRAKSISPNT